MITEDTIKQTKFYRGQDGQDYMATVVRGVRICTLVNCSDGIESKLLLGDDVCSMR